jgi:dTDP-4-dehydrorhamnose reductase
MINTIIANLIKIEFFFTIKGTNYIIIITNDTNNSFRLYLKDSKAQEHIYTVDDIFYKNRNTDELSSRVKKELIKIQLKNTFNKGSYYYLNLFLRDSVFKNLNINKEKLKEAIKEKLKIQTEDQLELEASRTFNLRYNSREKVFTMSFMQTSWEEKEEVEIYISLNDI